MKPMDFNFIMITIVLTLFFSLSSPASTTCHVTAPVIDKDPKGLNVRAAPMKNIVSKIPYNDYKPATVVHIIEAKNGWVKVNEWSDGTGTARFKEGVWLYGGLVATSREVYDQPVCQTCLAPKFLGQLAEKEPVKLIDCNEQGWLLAEGQSTTGENLSGWLPPYYDPPILRTQAIPTTEVPEIQEGHCVGVQAYIIDRDPEGLNVRSGPSIKQDIISKIPYNSYGISTRVDIADAKEGWLRIREWFDGAVQAKFEREAWIYGRLVAILVKVGGDNHIYASDVHTARRDGKFVEGRPVMVLDCGKEWLFVEGQSTYGSKRKGWLSPYGQALSPYAE